MTFFILARTIILFGATAANALLVMFVYKNNPKSATNQLFAILCLIMSVWLAILFFAEHPAFVSSTLILARLSIVFAMPLSATFFIFAHTIPSVRLTLNKKLLAAIIIATIAIMVINFSPYAFVGVDIVNGSYRTATGPGILPFSLLSTLFSAGAIYLLFRKLHSARGIEAAQLRFVVAGMLSMLGLVIATILIPVIFFQNSFFVIFSPIYVLLFLGAVAYAIVKHRFLDIRLVVMRAISFTLLLITSAIIYALIFFVGLRYFANLNVNTTLFAVFIAMTAIAMLTFQPLLGIIEARTKKIFFRSSYEVEGLLSELTRIMSSTIDLDKMVVELMETIAKELQVGKVAFLVVDKDHLLNFRGVGYHDHEYNSPELEDLLLHKNLYSVLIYDELEEPAKELFRELDIAIALPIRVEKDDEAILILGPKLSGEIYYPQEINLLRIFASEAGVAIQNAQAYLEIKRLNEWLENLVDERTRELKKTQAEELAKAMELARLKDEFVFIAVHELRAPVAAIRGFLELIGNMDEDLPFKTRDFLKSISLASNHLRQLVNDILEIARSESSATKVEVRAVDPAPIIKEIMHELDSSAKGRKVEIKFDEANMKKIMADEEKLKEVFTNLISNGIKYNKIGGKLAIGASDDSNNLVIEFHDTGLGIPKEEQDKIFQKFFRGGSKKVRLAEGTGLGLFIARMLVEKMGGKIIFRSEERKGTTFKVYLPKEN